MPKGVPNKRYTGEFKQMVVETIMKDKLSYRETAQQSYGGRVYLGFAGKPLASVIPLQKNTIYKTYYRMYEYTIKENVRSPVYKCKHLKCCPWEKGKYAKDFIFFMKNIWRKSIIQGIVRIKRYRLIYIVFHATMCWVLNKRGRYTEFYEKIYHEKNTFRPAFCGDFLCHHFLFGQECPG